MQQALALIESDTTAAGLAAVDQALKRAPVALLRCGTVHPGRYLMLLGGSVAATAEAHAAALTVVQQHQALVDEVLLPDPHPQLANGVNGESGVPGGEALGVMELGTSPGLLRAVDRVLKTVPVHLCELRLADDLGGHGLALVSGRLPDVQVALDLAREHSGRAQWRAGSLLPRLDDTLRDVLAEGTRFAPCRAWQPTGAETVED